MKKRIAIVLGSKSDLETIRPGLDILERLKIEYKLEVISAHRNPEELRRFCKRIERQGIEVVIACAGLSAALPGFIASYVNIPVVGVPLDAGEFKGLESLLSIVEVPKGLGLVSTGIGKKGFINAIVFSLKILSLSNKSFALKLKSLKNKFKK